MCGNCYGCSSRSGLKEDRSLGSDSLVTWRDWAGHIRRRWVHVRTQRTVLSTKREGTEIAGGVRDVTRHPQSRNSFEAGKRSVISIRRLGLFPAKRK